MPGAFPDWQALARFPFGDGPDLADELLDLILIGKKHATCWSAAEGVKGTVVAGRWVAQDGQGRPRAVLETVALSQQHFDQVDADFAAAEGEGDLSLGYWRAAHQGYFTRNGGFTPDMLLWCERFDVIAILPGEVPAPESG
ncbi:ASCH domain-containing protein [Novosphingobium sp.]|uniref:ASCH domain-containing protein n=1 Tax=Novosphingobium sp. TaxID=1874826 RepID=UPI00286B9AC9|nr:ASCH domain-containing protein [Novosphingobium sp.]